MRHRHFPDFIDLLARFRRGIYIQQDIDYLNKRCLSNMDTNIKEYCPFITAANVTRFEMNKACVYAYALQNKRMVFQVIAETKDGQIRTSFLSLRDDSTGRLCMLLEIVIGMPVSCTINNFSSGLANGTIGNIEGIQWPRGTIFTSLFTDSGVNIQRASQLPEYIFMRTHQSTSTRFCDLPPGIIPVRPIKQTVNFVLASRKFSKRITQVPIVPAFSITTDKSQGLTFKRSIVDSQTSVHRKRPPVQVLYVALSRVTNPNNMRFMEEITLDYLNFFKPSKDLIEIDKTISERSKNTTDFF